ncbi:MAG: flagellar assembly protein FliW [Proteobacteria bacterium]|nr:MAG: flagellar assembly protein FliW [Pseudomonadota bacterium]
MVIQTSRFGSVQLQSEDVIDFPEGILGFNDLRKFILLDDPNDEIFAWLQSCEVPQIAFPVLEPELFTSNYSVMLTKHDLESLGLQGTDAKEARTRSFSIITIPDDATQMTANLKAPIVINIAKRCARQIVLQDNNLAIREPIFAKLQSRVVSNPQSSIKSQATDWGVAIRLPEKGGPGTDAAL